MLKIGITGKTGAGKTTALQALKDLGAIVIDCDQVYHELLRTSTAMKTEIEQNFHGVIINNVLDRKALAQIVFSDPKALAKLEKITHKYVTSSITEILGAWEEQGGNIVAIDAIALIESGIADMCDTVVAVTAPDHVRIRRIMARDGISEQAALERANAQKPDCFYIDNCDFVLTSRDDTAESFVCECKAFFANLIGGFIDV